MSLTITKVDVWAAEITDTPGGLAKLLGALAGAGADLECVVEQPIVIVEHDMISA